MAAALTRARCRVAVLALAALLLAPAAGRADEELRDPTLPPARTAADRAAPAAAPAPLRLQMIVRGPGEQRRALIAGPRLQSVAVGDEFDTGSGPARVLRIGDASVLLARDTAHERLDLHPDLRSPTAAASRAADPIPAHRSGR